MSPGLLSTGYALEFVSPACSGNVAIYRIASAETREPHLEDYVVQATDVFCLTSLMYDRLESPPLGSFLSLESLLVGLYTEHTPAISIIEFLTEFRRHLPLRSGLLRVKRARSGLLKKELEEAGFRLGSFFQYGRTFNIFIYWAYPQGGAQVDFPSGLTAVTIDCRPEAGRSLGKGKWMLPINTSVGFLLSGVLKKMVGRDPLKALSEEGKKTAIETFKWTKVSLLSPEALKKARLDFVRQHPELHAQLRELAKAMKKAELYSDTTELHAISKQIPRLIEAVLGANEL